ncbi:hypothetical protein [Paraburkholderia domus]|uniref:hypothetical protein n=1 Tax=Paraburkholderia domus TaxID=2793075 RepID=UPI001911E72C|nr:hypothetical protein [Paraburkholderia domus]MBK5061749.1 hypothetical protein [Burkholderia sp. R-70199]
MWRINGEVDPHGTQYDCERAALTLGTLTDDELANGAFMNYDRRQSLEEMLNPKPGQHMPIVWMTAVKDRIRWLSRALERALAPASKVQADHIADERTEAVSAISDIKAILMDHRIDHLAIRLNDAMKRIDAFENRSVSSTGSQEVSHD